METLSKKQIKVDLSTLELNTAILKVRQDRKTAEESIKAPMAESDIPADVKREIASVIGTNTCVEVRFDAWENIQAREVVLENGDVVTQYAEDVRVYSVVIPNIRMKRGYKTYVRISSKIDAPQYHDFPSTWFVVVPAMWRRVAFMPNSRSVYGTIGAYLQQWNKHNWSKRSSHAKCVSDVYGFEQYVR